MNHSWPWTDTGGNLGARARLSYLLANRGSMAVKGANLKEESTPRTDRIRNVPSYVWLQTDTTGNIEDKLDIVERRTPASRRFELALRRDRKEDDGHHNTPGSLEISLALAKSSRIDPG